MTGSDSHVSSRRCGENLKSDSLTRDLDGRERLAIEQLSFHAAIGWMQTIVRRSQGETGEGKINRNRYLYQREIG